MRELHSTVVCGCCLLKPKGSMSVFEALPACGNQQCMAPRFHQPSLGSPPADGERVHGCEVRQLQQLKDAVAEAHGQQAHSSLQKKFGAREGAQQVNTCLVNTMARYM